MWYEQVLSGEFPTEMEQEGDELHTCGHFYQLKCRDPDLRAGTRGTQGPRPKGQGHEGPRDPDLKGGDTRDPGTQT